MDFLLFRLYGPMASWGEIAVGESRHTANYPSKSAIIGLITAALGIKRTEIEKHQRIIMGYSFAVESYSHGTLLRDFHTAQVPDSTGKFIYRTRRDELVTGKSRLGTILSSREYRLDALAMVAVKALPSAFANLQTLKEHLEKPKFHLYLGRKSCPLAAPTDPQLIEGVNNFFEAFKAYKHKPLLPAQIKSDKAFSDRDAYWLGVHHARHYYWDGSLSDFSDTLDMNRLQTRIRHDQPISRTRWQFSPRHEHYLYLPGGE